MKSDAVLAQNVTPWCRWSREPTGESEPARGDRACSASAIEGYVRPVAGIVRLAVLVMPDRGGRRGVGAAVRRHTGTARDAAAVMRRADGRDGSALTGPPTRRDRRLRLAGRGRPGDAAAQSPTRATPPP